MPLSEFTIAIGGRFCIPPECRLRSLCADPPASLDLGIEVAETVIGIHAQLLQRLAVLFKDVLKENRDGMTKILGSETFIMVAFRWIENKTPSSGHPESALRETCAKPCRS